MPAGVGGPAARAPAHDQRRLDRRRQRPEHHQRRSPAGDRPASPSGRPATTIGVPIAMPSTATAALRRGTIRVPRTVGRKWSSVDTMTSDTNPITFVHACAGRSCAQRSRTGEPARDGERPDAAPPIGHVDQRQRVAEDDDRAADHQRPPGPTPGPRGPVSSDPGEVERCPRDRRQPRPRRARSRGRDQRRADRHERRPPPPAAARRAGRPAASAATKNGMTPAIAVEAPPASARWSGSQGETTDAPSRPRAPRSAATRYPRPRRPRPSRSGGRRRGGVRAGAGPPGRGAVGASGTASGGRAGLARRDRPPAGLGSRIGRGKGPGGPRQRVACHLHKYIVS